MFFKTADIVPFALRSTPPPRELGRVLDSSRKPVRAVFHFHYADAVASERICDLWSACYELALQRQLVRERKLSHFVLDVDQIFEVDYAGDRLICRYSPVHTFVVDQHEFQSAIGQFLDDLCSATRMPALTQISIDRGAAAIRARPYFAKFSAFSADA